VETHRTDEQQGRRNRGGERRQHGELPSRLAARGRSAIALAVMGIGVVCLLNGLHRVGQTFPGFLILENRIVVSIGRPEWELDKTARMLFAEVVGIEDHPSADALGIQHRVSALPVGTAVTYRFRKGAEVFTQQVHVKPFTVADYLALYATYFVVGMCFALASLWIVWQPTVSPAAGSAFFVFCQMAALVLLTGADQYGPYWFTTLYFSAFSLAPAAVFHLASSFPEPIGARSRWRRLLVGFVYAMGGGCAVAFYVLRNDTSLFLPLLYTVYLLLANALLLYVARLLVSRMMTSEPAERRRLDLALTGILLSGLVAGVIFVTYPALQGPVSPLLLVTPLAMFPLLTAAALRGSNVSPAPAARVSVHLRLSLLFLGSVETAFLVAVAVFWLNTSRDRLMDDFTLNQRHQGLVQRLLEAPTVATSDLAPVAALVQTTRAGDLVATAGAALGRNDAAAARQALRQLREFYARNGTLLDARRHWMDRIAASLVLGLVALGVVQAVAFMLAVRRWLIGPIDQIAAATSVIATGDLSHRVDIPSSEEFGRLASAINVMASSLGEIQRQVNIEQQARQHAAGAARNAERHRLARELHDSVLQDLTAVKLHLESEGRRPTPALQPMIDNLMGVIVDLRRIVDDLRPPDLGETTLAEAIGAHAEVVARAHGIALTLDLSPEVDVADWAARDLYRIAQESMSNAVRYAGPKQLKVRLYRAGAGTVLEVADDGAGFELQKAVLGSGIIGMRARAAAVGAKLEILSGPGRGTIVRLVLPSQPSSPWQ
jgi:two-component system, NarL family, sensor histidine kinase UhpB